MRWDERMTVQVAWHQRCRVMRCSFSPTKFDTSMFIPKWEKKTKTKVDPQKVGMFLVNECFFHLFSGYGFEDIRRRCFFRSKQLGQKTVCLHRESRVAGTREQHHLQTHEQRGEAKTTDLHTERIGSCGASRQVGCYMTRLTPWAKR